VHGTATATFAPLVGEGGISLIDGGLTGAAPMQHFTAA